MFVPIPLGDFGDDPTPQKMLDGGPEELRNRSGELSPNPHINADG
jgi:hypothetical protein